MPSQLVSTLKTRKTMYKTKGTTLLFKMQAVADTPETPDGSNAFKTMELGYDPYQGPTGELKYDTDGQGNSPQQNFSPEDNFNFKTALFASGVAGTEPPQDPAFRACGMNVTVDPGVSVTYNTIDVTENATEFATVARVKGNKLYKASDCMGDFGFMLKSKDFPKFEFSNFIGTHIEPTTTGAITPDLSAWLPPIPVSKDNTPTCTIGGWQGCVDELSFTMGNVINRHDRIACEGIQITERKPSAKLVVEAPDIASKNFWQEMASHEGTINLYDVVFSHGVNAGEIFGGTIFDCQIIGIKEVDLDGTVGYEMELNPVGTQILQMVFT